MKKKRVKRFFATYTGTQRNMRLSPGIGRVVPGRSFEVTEKIANALKSDPNFIVKDRRK